MAETRFHAVSTLLFLCFFVLTLSTSAHNAEGVTADNDDIPFLDQESEKNLDIFQLIFGNWLRAKAAWFDSFFEDDTYLAESNETDARASLAVGYSRKDGWEFSPRFRLRLRLPGLEEKARLYISSSEDKRLTDDSDTPIGTVKDDSEKDSVTATFQYFLRKGVNKHLSITAGASFDYLYGGIRARFSQDFGLWNNRFINNLRYYTDDGLENKASIEMDHPLNSKLMFRGIVSGDWYRDEVGFDHAIRLRVYQFIDIHHSARYEAGFYCVA